ncbi:hypothetical protein NC652_030682 [Populus alba x Populus x berolinensis]|nr:hypothetical protein NC652_030682 [Populus alba x Populus x berolinensis]
MSSSCTPREQFILCRIIKGAFKLADFGASKQVVELATVSGAKSLKGTPYWMAPDSHSADRSWLVFVFYMFDRKAFIDRKTGEFRFRKMSKLKNAT